ncbi:hypothetical protein Pmgp_03823 [Pelotomaculum propionicicum]|uniref:Uncharacterized protein n=1 Tax=Pelotomaculum propionicicum TaxID=258475 RepID=A0A4Y7R8Q1_9FIRM|nr:hypothetical protein Pmgp_03823 [Pelotomaculum propionicicum]
MPLHLVQCPFDVGDHFLHLPGVGFLQHAVHIFLQGFWQLALDDVPQPYRYLPELLRGHTLQHAGQISEPADQLPGVHGLVQVEHAGHHVGRPAQVFLAVADDVKEDVVEVQQVPGKPLVPRLVLPEAPAGGPAVPAVVENCGNDGGQPEALALPLLPGDTVAGVPPHLHHVLQQAEWHGVVHGGLQLQEYVEYHFGPPETQPVHDVGLLVAEVSLYV